MSAVRSTPANRRITRQHNSSPYNRTQKSSWLSGLFHFLNPLRLTRSEADLECSPELRRAGSELAERGEEIADQQRNGQNQPEVPAPQELHSEGSQESVVTAPPSSPSVEGKPSTSKNIEAVTAFLAEKGNKPLNRVEVAGLVSLLQESIEDEDKPEPFRFSTTPTSPGRGTPPSFNLGTSASTSAVPQQGAKVLTRNPNGPYRWQGGGSARPRNRYQSPAFGPSRPVTSRIKLSPAKPTTDTKRRRVEAQSSMTQRALEPTPLSRQDAMSHISISATARPSPPVANGAGAPSTSEISPLPSKPNGAPPTTPHIRTNGLKPSTPAVPSPLRQTWGQAASSSPPQPPPASRPTRAANIMTELIKEATPPQKPGFSNPYQAASPVPVKPAPKKPSAKRRKEAAAPTPAETTAVPPAPEPPKAADLSPQKIIEATVPKGSKRSRPPTELERPQPKAPTEPAGPTRRSARLRSPEPAFPTNGFQGFGAFPTNKKAPAVVVEEVSDEGEPSPKKQKKASKPATNGARLESVTIEEVEDVEMSSSSQTAPSPAYTRPSQIVEPDESESTSPTSSTALGGPFGQNGASRLKSSAPKAPSKLRYSFQAEKEEREREKELAAAAPESAAPAIPPSMAPAFSWPAPQPPKAAPKVAPKTKEEARDTVIAMNVDELPKYAFDFPTSSPGAGPSNPKAREAALSVPVSSLPTYNFSVSATSSSTLPTAAPIKEFNWEAAGMKRPAEPTGDWWKCSSCDLSNPASATEKCTVCETPRPDKPAAPAATGFDWAAAGMKQPQASADVWKCSTCSLENPNTKDKCTICDAPR